MSDYQHIPVLLNEVLQYLDPRPGENFVDATLGGGGYSRAILERVRPGGRVLSIDLDPAAIENAKSQLPKFKGWEVVRENFRNIDKAVKKHQLVPIHGVVADLGLSSNQLDNSERGLSFQKKELLDMRFDPGIRADAKFILNNYSTGQLAEVFKNYGEERFAGKIAGNILKARETKPIKYTTELYEIIEQSLPKPVRHKARDSARRIFQAMRIEVNKELENLEEFLPKAFELLSPGGRMAIVTFHSLEDRMVKHFFAGLAKGCVCPPEFPICQCGRDPKARILTRKPATAGRQELEGNSRSKPAKLRAISKI